MLETSEILALEKRWKSYKIQYYTKCVLLFLFLASSIPLAWFMYDFVFSKQEKIEITQNVKHITKKENKEPKELNNSYMNYNEQNNTKNSIASNNMLQKYAELNKGIQKELEALRRDLEKTKIHKQSIIQPKFEEEIIDQEFLEENLLVEETGVEAIEEIEEKPRINIESNELKGLDNLQKKFYQTKNIIFSLMLAEEYYHKKDYKKSLKWALISNETDPANERSWIIFAKSKAKSGQANKAIDALKAYLKTHPNAQEIKTLIGKIKQGNY